MVMGMFLLADPFIRMSTDVVQVGGAARGMGCCVYVGCMASCWLGHPARCGMCFTLVQHSKLHDVRLPILWRRMSTTTSTQKFRAWGLGWQDFD